MTRSDMEKAFRQAEASLSLEGLDPLKVSEYRDLKARVLDGALSFRQARDAYARLFIQGRQAAE